jgi:WD40 repeat protein
VHQLTDMLCAPEDARVQAAASVLRSLRSPAAVDRFCHEILLRHNPTPAHLAISCGFAPSVLSRQAVFFFVTGQQERLATLDPDSNHLLLAQGYLEAPAAIRARVRTVARDSCRSIVFAQMFIGPGRHPDPSGWSPDDWDLIVNGLSRECRYEDLWSLLFSAPPPAALEALQTLQRAGWIPPADDSSVMREIFSKLPDSWTYPVPRNNRDLLFETADSQTGRLAFSPDGNLLATGDCAGEVRIWQTGRGTHLRLLPAGHTPVRFLAFSHDGELLLVCREDGILSCHDVRDGSPRWSHPAVSPEGAAVCCAVGGEMVVTGDTEGNLITTDVLTGLQRIFSRGSSKPVSCLLLLSGNGKIAAGYEDGSVSIHDVVDGSTIMTIAGTGYAVRALVEGRGTLVIVYDKTPPACYDTLSGERLVVYTGWEGPAGCFAAAGNGSWFSLAGTDHAIRIWRHVTPGPVAVIPFYNRNITCCTAAIDNTLLVCGCSEGTMRAFCMPETRLIWETKAHDRALAALTLSPDGRILASAGWDGIVSLRDAGTGKIIRTLRRKVGAIAGLVLTPCRSYAVCGFANGTASVYDCHDGSLVNSFDLYAAQVKAVALSPDGRILASAGGDSTLRLWEVRNGSLITGLEGLTTTASCLVFAPDAQMLFAGGWDGRLRLWSVPEGRLLADLPGHTSTIVCCAVTPDGTQLVTGSNDTTAAIWSLPGLNRLTTIAGSKSEVSAVAIAPAGDLFAAGDSDAAIRLFWLPCGTCAGTIPIPPGKVTSLVFTTDGTALIVGYDTGTITVFTCPGGLLIHSTGAHLAAVRGLGVVSSGSVVISAGGDGEIRLSPLPWTRPLSATALEEIPGIAAHVDTGVNHDKTGRQWQFLHGLLAARFRQEIGLCMLDEGLDAFDIQIVG